MVTYDSVGDALAKRGYPGVSIHQSRSDGEVCFYFKGPGTCYLENEVRGPLSIKELTPEQWVAEFEKLIYAREQSTAHVSIYIGLFSNNKTEIRDLSYQREYARLAWIDGLFTNLRPINYRQALKPWNEITEIRFYPYLSATESMGSMSLKPVVNVEAGARLVLMPYSLKVASSFSERTSQSTSVYQE